MRLNTAVLVKLEPDFSEGNVSYNADGTLNRAETKNILGPHSSIACYAALYAKVKYEAHITVATMGPPTAEFALQQSQLISDADELHLYSDRLFAGADTLATSEVLKAGVKKMINEGDIDIVFSGHRASDGETGQTGPQTAWKLGYPLIGNVIEYNIDIPKRLVNAKRIIRTYGHPDRVEEIEVSLPVFITLDPSYFPLFNTVSQRLKLALHRKNALYKSYEYANYLKTFNVQSLELNPKLVGLPGSPTIVYKVEKIPRSNANRKAYVVDWSNETDVSQLISTIYDILGRNINK